MTGASPSEVERVAASLTAAQRAFLLSLPATGERHWPFGMREEERAGLRGFGQSGLIESRYVRTGEFHALTPLGLAVRQYLERQSHVG